MEISGFHRGSVLMSILFLGNGSM